MYDFIIEHLDEKFWLAVSFIIFLYFAYRPIKRAILTSLDAKITDIKTQILEAETLKKEATLLLERTKEEVTKLAYIQEKMLSEAKKATQNMIADKEAEIEKILKHQKAQAFIMIDNKKLQAKHKTQNEFVDFVTKVVEEYFKAESDNKAFSDGKIAQKFIDKK